MPPWEWRHGGKSGSASPTLATPAPTVPITTASGSYTCGGKRYCREMTSCEEARFYLTQCGVSSLDGNHDGVPCAKLCR
jgi:hypothetical protein